MKPGPSVKKILMIDDDRELCEEIGEILRDEGYEVTVKNDGLAGLEEVKKNRYDLLLLDVKLPGLNGLDILAIVRAQKIDLRVILVTGRPALEKSLKKDLGPDNREEAALKLANRIITKPFDVKRLLGQIKLLLSEETPS